MEDFTIEQLGLFITLMMGGCGGLLAVIFKSRCETIECCGIKIHRKVLEEKNIDDNNIDGENNIQRRNQEHP